MATRVSVPDSSKGDKLHHDPLEHCPICLKRFTDPKMLDCLHSYCLKCLEELLPNKHRDAVNVQCPVCKQNTFLPEQGVNGLVSCSSLASLILVDDEVAHRSKVICEACDLGQEAVSRCVDCEDYLCKDCQEAHQRMLKMRSHDVVALEDLPKCGNHDGQELCFFCETCQVLICGACTVVAHSQPEHKYVGLEEADHSFREQVDAEFAKVDLVHREQKAAKISSQHSRDRLETMIAEARQKVSEKANEYHAYVQQQEKVLQERIDQVKHKRAVEIDISLTNQNQTLANTERRLDTVRSFVAKASPCELLAKKQTILNGIHGVKAVHFQDHGLLHGLSYLNFKPGSAPTMEPLGTLLLEERWKLVKEFSNFKMARGVAANSKGHIAVVDSERNFLIIITDPKGREQRRNSAGVQMEKLRKPFSVCINTLDQLVVIDSPKVMVLDKDLKYLFQFTPSRDDKEEESKTLLSALAVDQDNQIAVGDRGRGVITLHKPDGALIHTIPSPTVENQLAVNLPPNRSLIYSSYEDNRLTSIDYEGNPIFSVDTLARAKFRNPTGICCSPTGDIFVAGHLDVKEQSGIYYFNPVGEYLGCLALGLCNPLSMALTPAGELAVADKLTVKVYHRV
ncbi:tripartite motif-containing protein 45-like [Patiria miniata]|uniref:Uncharacterized protein n=1 Tax=Patiria miniata TaxID=46514 RepID=A0A914A7X1_PATMI|nr:tripartite motif-containing protein 45-like [Patiria miniata]